MKKTPAKKPASLLTKAIRDRFTKSAAAGTLREEIALARFTLEQIINSAEDADQLWRRADRIDALLMTIKILVETNARLERQTSSEK